MLGSVYIVAMVTASVIAPPVLSMVCGGEPADPWEQSGYGSCREEAAGHYGPAWGYVGGEPAIVFRWNGGQRGRDGSIYVIRPDGTQVAYATLRNGERAGNYDIVARLDGRPGLLFFGGDRARQQLTEGGISQSEPA